MTSQNAVERVSKGAAGAWRLVGRIPNRLRLAIRDIQEARESVAERAKGPTVSERQDDLSEFYERYEDLVDVLCGASNYGPDGRLESKYAELRTWMQRNYPAQRLYVVAFLRFDTRDAEQALNWVVAVDTAKSGGPQVSCFQDAIRVPQVVSSMYSPVNQ